MITFFRHCYYAMYLFFKKLDHKYPDESAFVWMAGIRMLVYLNILLIIGFYLKVTNEDFSKTALTFLFFGFEMVVSYFINGKRKFPIIQAEFEKLSVNAQSAYKYVGISLMPLLIILMFLIIFHIKDSQGIGW